MPIAHWTAEEARGAIATANLDRELGVARGVPAVVVELPRGDAGADIAAALRSVAVVSIAADPAAANEWDLALTDPTAAIDGIQAAPNASVVTAQTLRQTSIQSPSDGLLTESLAYATLQSGPELAAWLSGQGRRTRNDDAPRIRIDTTAEGATIVFTRGRLRNLLDAQMRDELVEALRTLQLDPELHIVMRGEGPAFCAGGDPAEFGTVSDPATAHLIRTNANVAPWLLAVADRIEAQIHGPCVGAGVELAAFCGRVTATADARFRLPETRMGLLPGAGGTVSVPRRIGSQRTLEWLLTGAEIDARTALGWGLVDELRDA